MEHVMKIHIAKHVKRSMNHMKNIMKTYLTFQGAFKVLRNIEKTYYRAHQTTFVLGYSFYFLRSLFISVFPCLKDGNTKNSRLLKVIKGLHCRRPRSRPRCAGGGGDDEGGGGDHGSGIFFQ